MITVNIYKTNSELSSSKWDSLVLHVSTNIFLNNLHCMISLFVKRKYATHLFTKTLSNVLSDNMMSRLILTLTKQFFDNQLTHFKIKTWKVLCHSKSLKGLYILLHKVF